MKELQAVVVIGSPRRGSSFSLGNYMAKLLEQAGVTCEVVRLVGIDEHTLCHKVNAADIVVFAIPLYVDSPPAMVMSALEAISRSRLSQETKPEQSLSIIVSCGFPEAHQANVTIQIFELFSLDNNFAYAGGLALGQAPSIGDNPVENITGMLRYAVQALKLAAEALSEGRAIPEAASGLMAKPIIPNIAYRFMVHMGFRSELKRNGANAKAQPYAH